MATMFYDLPSDKVTGTVSKTGGTVNAVYPLANIDNDEPWNPVIFTANPSRIIWDHTSPVRLDLASFIHCNFPAAYVPVVARGSVIGTPLTSVNVSCIGPDPGDNMPPNPIADLTLATGYGNYRYTWIDLPVTATLLSLGLVRLSSHKRVISDLSTTVRDRDYGAVDREHHPSMERPTDAGVQLGYSRGTRARWASGNLRSDATGYAEYLTLKRATRGRFKPSLFVPDPSENEAWFVKWGIPDTPHQRTWTDYGVFDCPFDVEELGRGLAP